MSRMKCLLAISLLTACLSFAPLATAAPVMKVMIAGSSAMWQSLALAAYKSGACVGGLTAPCAHYTGGSNFNLTDTRPLPNVVDTGAIWIVWDKTNTDPTCNACNIMAYIKVDSVVGNR